MKYMITYQEKDHRMITELMVDESDLAQVKQDLKDEGFKVIKTNRIS